METVAVIIPAYNAGKKIKKCIKSIQGQSYKNLQILVVNDGSTDNTGIVVSEIAETDSRIKIIEQKNSGAAKARRTGVESADVSCSYVVFADADDYMPRKAIEIMVNIAEVKEADFICGKIERIFKGIAVKQTYVAPCLQISGPKEYSHEEIMDRLFVSYFGITDFPATLWGKLYSRELISKAVSQEIPVRAFGEDLCISLDVLPNAEKLVIIPDIVYSYCMGGGTSRFIPNYMEECKELYLYKKPYIKKYNMSDEVIDLMDCELINMLKSYLLMCLEKRGDSREKLINEINVQCADPLIKKAALTYKDRALSNAIANDDSDYIYAEIIQMSHGNKIKNFLKKLIN